MVRDGRVTGELHWLSASEEEDFAVAQANAMLKSDGSFEDTLVLCRRGDDYPLLPPSRIDYMDVAPEQLVSIAAFVCRSAKTRHVSPPPRTFDAASSAPYAR